MTIPSYNNGSLPRGQRYGCGCIAGVYDCCDELLCCGASPWNQEKIRKHRLELLYGPRSLALDADAFHARYGADLNREPECCSCHISAPCGWCLAHCPDCREHVDDCCCGTCNEVTR